MCPCMSLCPSSLVCQSPQLQEIAVGACDCLSSSSEQVDSDTHRLQVKRTKDDALLQMVLMKDEEEGGREGGKEGGEEEFVCALLCLSLYFLDSIAYCLYNLLG